MPVSDVLPEGSGEEEKSLTELRHIIDLHNMQDLSMVLCLAFARF